MAAVVPRAQLADQPVRWAEPWAAEPRAALERMQAAARQVALAECKAEQPVAVAPKAAARPAVVECKAAVPRAGPARRVVVALRAVPADSPRQAAELVARKVVLRAMVQRVALAAE